MGRETSRGVLRDGADYLQSHDVRHASRHRDESTACVRDVDLRTNGLDDGFPCGVILHRCFKSGIELGKRRQEFRNFR